MKDSDLLDDSTLHFEENKSLQPFHTFGLEAFARYFVSLNFFDQKDDLLESPIFQKYRDNVLVLGGGSNMVFTSDFDGLVIQNNLQGIRVVFESDTEVHLKANGGVVWDDLVAYTVKNGWCGLENLSLIPGSVGAAPIQNIGAYGVELKDVFLHLEALDLQTGEVKVFGKRLSAFGYRDSYFKREGKGRYLITSVLFRLKKNTRLNVSYGAIEKTLQERGIAEPTVQDVRDVVIAIRQSKLPDPAVIGNSGSFFKNPLIETSRFEILKEEHEAMVGYPQEGGMTKVSAGWLIEQCGLKGKRFGNVGMYEKQALVMVNNGEAKGKEVLDMIDRVRRAVQGKFGIDLQPEVNCMG